MGSRSLGLTGRHAIVFGGSGFIGQHLVASLVQAGAPVLVADIRKPSRLPPGARFASVDVRRPIKLGFEWPDPVVFNLAAVHRTPGHSDDEYFDTNVRGAENVTAFCDGHSATSLWFTSSISVYGASERPRDEASSLCPTGAYGRSKVEAERIHRRWAEAAAGRRLVIARPAAVFGPGESGNFARLAAALRRGVFFYPGRRDTIKACGHVEDLVGSMYFMHAAADPVAIYNYGYADPPTLERICQAFHDVAGLPLPRGTVPYRAAIAGGRLLNAIGVKALDPRRIEKLLVSTNVQPQELTKRGFAYETDLESGIARWYEADPYGQFV